MSSGESTICAFASSVFVLRFQRQQPHVLTVLDHFAVYFYHAAIMRPLVHDLIVVEVSSHTAKLVPVQSYNSFLHQRSRKVTV